MAIDVAPQVGDDALAEPGDQVGTQIGRQRQSRDHDGDCLDRVIEGTGPVGAEAAVDQVTQAHAEREHGGGGDDEREQRAGDVAAIGAKIGSEPPELAKVAAARTLTAELCQGSGPCSICHALRYDRHGDANTRAAPLELGAARRYIPAAFPRGKAP